MSTPGVALQPVDGLGAGAAPRRIPARPWINRLWRRLATWLSRRALAASDVRAAK